MMVLCKFFQNGYCKFGQTCRFEHSRAGGYGGGGGGEHYGFQGRSQGYNSTAGYGQAPNRFSNYDNRADYRNDNQGGYRSDYRNDNQSEFRSDNRSNNSNIYRSENRFAVLDNRHDDSRRPDSNQHRGGGAGGGRQYDTRYNYRRDQHKTEGEDEELTTAEILECITEDMEMWQTGKMWLFSCYGYTREMKSFPGLDDLSPEEIRLKAYEAHASGAMVAHVNWLSQLTEDYKVKQAALRKPDPVARSALLNLIEQIKKSSSPNISITAGLRSDASAFISPTNAFGAPNAFGAATPTTNAFSGSAYSGTMSPEFSVVPSAHVVPTSVSAVGFGTSTLHNAFSAAETSTGFMPASNARLNGAENTPSANQQNTSAQPYYSSSSSSPLALYTPLAELTTEERAAFENAKFTVGHVPIRPPPKDFV